MTIKAGAEAVIDKCFARQAGSAREVCCCGDEDRRCRALYIG